MIFQATYVYLGDKLTDPEMRGLPVDAIRRADGKCVRGKNGNMAVADSTGKQHIVLGRHLVKRKD